MQICTRSISHRGGEQTGTLNATWQADPISGRRLTSHDARVTSTYHSFNQTLDEFHSSDGLSQTQGLWHSSGAAVPVISSTKNVRGGAHEKRLKLEKGLVIVTVQIALKCPGDGVAPLRVHVHPVDSIRRLKELIAEASHGLVNKGCVCGQMRYRVQRLPQFGSAHHCLI